MTTTIFFGQRECLSVSKRAGGGLHVLDRFHIMARMNKALDDVRGEEARELRRNGYMQVLKYSPWCLLKRPENLTERQTVKIAELLGYNLRSVRSYLHREDFQPFWEYRCPWAAARFFRDWSARVMRSRTTPMRNVAKSLPNPPA